MLPAETAGIHGPELRMVSAAPLCDVVEEGRRYSISWRLTLLISRLQSGNSCASSGMENRRKLRTHPQNVLVHGVDVVEIVLHLPDDAAKGRQ